MQGREGQTEGENETEKMNKKIQKQEKEKRWRRIINKDYFVHFI